MGSEQSRQTFLIWVVSSQSQLGQNGRLNHPQVRALEQTTTGLTHNVSSCWFLS